MIYNYQYSELPDYKYPELIERKYLYPSDSVTIEIQTIGKEQTDSTFTMVQKNNFDLITKQTEYSTRTYQGYTGIDQSKIVTYAYGNKNELLQQIKIDLKFGDTLTTNYKYDNGKLIQKIYTDENMQRVQTYKDDLLISSDEKILDRASKTLYSYNEKGQETLSQKFENGKLVYSYKTKYNSKGLKMIYEMQDEVDRENVSYWLYEYDDQERLAYHINLFKKMTRPQKPQPVHEVRAK